MKRVIQCIVTTCCALLAHHAIAQDVQMTYQKERLILHPSETTNPEYANGVLLKVDVRKAGGHSRDWLQLTGYEAGTGLLEVSPNLAPLHIAPQNMMSPVDVIAFNEFGTVVTIAPNMVLSALERPIERGDIVKATLYTKAGFAEEIGLKIGDAVEYKLFATLPTVVDTTTADSAEKSEPVQDAKVEEQTVDNSNLQQDNPEEEKAAAEEPSPQALNRRAPAGNPGATPTPKKEPPPLLDTILRRHHQPNAIEHVQ